MSVVVGFAGVIAGLAVWWLAVSRLRTRSWEASAAQQLDAEQPAFRTASARVGLWVFLAVVTSFFGLLITAYSIRMSPQLVQGAVFQDWRPLRDPQILWLNTLLLLLASAGMQTARNAAGRGLPSKPMAGMLAGGVFAFAFLAGQWLAWRQLQAAGYYAAGNPAYAFFYVLTGLHGLHLMGGLVVWTRTVARMVRGDDSAEALRLTIELCTVYWHYLLVVWLVLFGLLLVT
jgi:cytochrome c oxidase subunit III